MSVGSILVPTLGNIGTFLLFTAPLRTVVRLRGHSASSSSSSRAHDSSTVAVVNGLPYLMMLLQCNSWIAYGYFEADGFIVFGNVVGALLASFYCLHYYAAITVVAATSSSSQPPSSILTTTTTMTETDAEQEQEQEADTTDESHLDPPTPVRDDNLDEVPSTTATMMTMASSRSDDALLYELSSASTTTTNTTTQPAVNGIDAAASRNRKNAKGKANHRRDRLRESLSSDWRELQNDCQCGWPLTKMVQTELILMFAYTFPLLTASIFAFAWSDNEQRTLAWGVVCNFWNISYFASPLSVMRTVLRTRDTTPIPTFLSVAIVYNGIMWTIYGLVTKDPRDYFIAIPNALGAVLGILQLLLIFYIRKISPRQRSADTVTGDLSSKSSP